MRIRGILNMLQVRVISLYVCIILIMLLQRFRKHHLYVSALGINIKMPPCSDVAYQRLGTAADIDLNPVNAAV